MDRKEIFINHMDDVTNVVMATVKGDKPNARTVSIVFDKQQPNTFYFTTFKGSAKTLELQENANVTIIPIPDKKDTNVTIRIHGTAAPAKISLEDFAVLMSKKLPEFAAELPNMKDFALFYQVSYSSAEVALGMDPPEVITF